MPQSRIAIFALLTLAIAGAAWLWWSQAEPAPAPGTVAHMANGADAAGGSITTAADEDAAVSDASTDLERTAATTTADLSAPTDGILRVTVLWPGDVPAAEVAIYVRRSQRRMPYIPLAHGVTDAQGVVELRGVPPGDATLISDRDDSKKVTVVAGPQDVTFELADGVAVRGTVTDPDGGRVAGAQIWLQTARTDWSGGRVLTATDAAGEFVLAHVSPKLSLGAIAAGFAPSKLIDLDVVDTSKPPAHVELQLQPGGGRLEGTVTDTDGRPIAGATVAAGKKLDRIDWHHDRIVEQWTARPAETAADGTFAIDGLAAGALPVAVRALGYGLWRGEAEIASGGTTVANPVLAKSAVIHGTVTDGDGAPIAEAAVSAYDRAPRTSFLAGGQIDFDETFGYVGALSDAHGRYRLEGVTPGTVHLFAQQNQKRLEGVTMSYTTAQPEIAPGSETVWDPILADGRAIEGIVLYRDGFPITSLFITLADERSGKEQILVSDREGVFRFLCLDDSIYTIRVQTWDPPKGSPPVQASGILPDRGRTELRATWDKPVEQKDGVVVGRVEDTAGRIQNPKAARVGLATERGFWPGREIVDGAFRFDRVTPGRVRPVLMEGEAVLATGEWFELLPAATLDLGVLTTEPAGAAKITVVRGEGTENFEPKLYLRRDGDARETVIELGRATAASADNLTPGNYTISSYFKGMVSVKQQATVTAGQTAAVTLTLRAGARCECEVWWPEHHTGSVSRHYRILDPAGAVFHEYEGELRTSPTRPYKLVNTLPRGRWKIEFSTDDGLRGETEVDVRNAIDPVTARIDLK